MKPRLQILSVAGMIALAGCPGLTDAGLTDDDAKQRALQAEETHLESQLRNASCLGDWGTNPTVTGEEATVVNNTGSEAYVRVVHPYWTSRPAVETDGATESIYRVTQNTTERIDGDRLSPCPPGHGTYRRPIEIPCYVSVHEAVTPEHHLGPAERDADAEPSVVTSPTPPAAGSPPPNDSTGIERRIQVESPTDPPVFRAGHLGRP